MNTGCSINDLETNQGCSHSPSPRRDSLLRAGRATLEMCHSTKRTHFIFAYYSMYHIQLQTIISFAEAFANGFVSEKRTHFLGSYEVLQTTKMALRQKTNPMLPYTGGGSVAQELSMAQVDCGEAESARPAQQTRSSRVAQPVCAPLAELEHYRACALLDAHGVL